MSRSTRLIIRRWSRRLFAALLIYIALSFVLTNEFALNTLLMYAFYGAFIVFWTGGQIFMFVWFMSRTKQRIFLPNEAGLPTLDDYLGQPRIKETVQQWVELLRGSDDFRKLGGTPPTGLLLYGPPGSGKTFLAQCIAGSAGIPLIYLDASSLQSVWFGIGNLKVIDVFRKAKKLAMEYGAACIYLDEIDAIASSRVGLVHNPQQSSWTANQMIVGGVGGGSGILSTLLHELDGSMDDFLITRIRNRIFGWLRIPVPPKDWHVFVFGSTNIPHVLDPALLRPGRLSRSLKVDKPDRHGRKEILCGYLSKIKLSDDVDVERLVDELTDATPAEIKSLVLEEAPRKALYEGCSEVHMRHFVSSIQEVRVGLRNPLVELDQKEKEQVATHEAGHALLTWLLTDRRISSVTIVRYGDALGHVHQVESRERVIRSLNELWVDAIISIGGRAAEIVVYGEPLRSVGGDYPVVMGKLRELLESGLWGSPVLTPREEAMCLRVLFDEALEKAKQLISDHRGEHWMIVSKLLEKEELSHEDIEEILGERAKVSVPNPQKPSFLESTRRRARNLSAGRGKASRKQNYARRR